jgi:hypothetical protein
LCLFPQPRTWSWLQTALLWRQRSSLSVTWSTPASSRSTEINIAARSLVCFWMRKLWTWISWLLIKLTWVSTLARPKPYSKVKQRLSSKAKHLSERAESISISYKSCDYKG